MLRTLIIGLGRAGADLHLPVMRRLRSGAGPWRSSVPVIGYDPAVSPDVLPPGIRLVDSLAEARSLLDPTTTVVHLCTPPEVRLEVLRELAELGFDLILMEKPIAADPAQLMEILRLRTRHRLRVQVVVFPTMATGRLRLRHQDGVETSIFSDLTAPLRERRITVDFDHGRLVGHYPVASDDHYAHLRLLRFGGGHSAEVLKDDGLGVFLSEAYEKYASGADLWPDLDLNIQVVRLLGDAKDFWTLAEGELDLRGVAESAR